MNNINYEFFGKIILFKNPPIEIEFFYLFEKYIEKVQIQIVNKTKHHHNFYLIKKFFYSKQNPKFNIFSISILIITKHIFMYRFYIQILSYVYSKYLK